MDKANYKSQIVKLSLIAALLFITPLLSSSLRTTYLYFIINLLIIGLGAEAGLFSFFSKLPHHDRKFSVPHVSAKPLAEQAAPADKEPSVISPHHTGVVPFTGTPDRTEKKQKAIEKSASEKICSGTAKLRIVRKSPSTPSIFFVGGGEAEAEEEAAAAAADIKDEEDQGEELFAQSETFIGDFYKQLKMQREKSRKRLHELYQKASERSLFPSVSQ